MISANLEQQVGLLKVSRFSIGWFVWYWQCKR